MTTQSSPFSAQAFASSGSAGYAHGAGSCTLTMRQPRALLGKEMPNTLFMSGIAGVDGQARNGPRLPEVAGVPGTITLTY
ncbi:MAG: hypothetical protein ABI907_02560 [Ramlibacter sp.]